MAEKTKPSGGVKAGGLGGDPLARRAAGRGRPSGRVAALQGAPEGDVVTSAALVDLAVNPDNPQGRSESVPEELVASIREIGVVVPLQVQSAAVFLAHHPEHVPEVGESVFVILAGHQRRVAAYQAGLVEVPVRVLDELGARADDVVVAENVHRTGLSALEEARAYQRIIERQGVSQRKLAEHLGVQQGQISKRLRLLKLPAQLHAAIDAGTMQLGEALEVEAVLATDARIEVALLERLASLSESDPARTWWDHLVRHAQAAVDAGDRYDMAVVAAAEHGVPVVKDPLAEFGDRAHQHLLHGKKEVDKARRNGTLVLAPATHKTGEVRYFTTSKPSSSSSTKSPHEQSAAREERERKNAMAARRAALAEVIQRADLFKVAGPLRTAALLHGLSLNAQAAKIGRKICGQAGIGPQGIEDDWAWRREVAEHPDGNVLASVVALAAWEDYVSWTHLVWGPGAARYVEWLAAHAPKYQPSAWEGARCARAHPDRGDSSESVATKDPDSGPSYAGSNDNRTLDDEEVQG